MNKYTLEELAQHQANTGSIVSRYVCESDYDALAAQVELLSAFRDEVVGVMNNSQGVTGWHLNGVIATWDELFPVVPDVESPATCLAQVKSEYFEKGFIQGVKFSGSGFVSESDYEEAKAYGDDIRQGGKE